MGKKHALSGLRQRNGIWHIEKMVDGTRLFESTRVSERAEAEKVLIHRLEQIRSARVFGVRPQRTFQEAATRYLIENQHKRSLLNEANEIERMRPYIGNLMLDKINNSLFIITKGLTTDLQLYGCVSSIINLYSK